MLKQIIFIVLISFNLAACVKKPMTLNTEKKGMAHHSIQNKKQTHLTKQSAKHYQEIGTASWYGKRFNRKRTSSGERYNMYHLTAAHKTLPLHTYVQVTNLKNGKNVIVKINDRGPFIRNRTIDLSYAAAKKIGLVHRGVAPVSIKVIKA